MRKWTTARHHMRLPEWSHPRIIKVIHTSFWFIVLIQDYHADYALSAQKLLLLVDRLWVVLSMETAWGCAILVNERCGFKPTQTDTVHLPAYTPHHSQFFKRGNSNPNILKCVCTYIQHPRGWVYGLKTADDNVPSTHTAWIIANTYTCI